MSRKKFPEHVVKFVLGSVFRLNEMFKMYDVYNEKIELHQQNIIFLCVLQYPTTEVPD